MKKLLYTFLAAFSLVIASCSDDDKIPVDADDNFITALTLTVEGTTYNAIVEGNDIVMSVPYIVNLNGATASMIYTPSAKILPNPATVTDWDNDMIFRVTSYNGDVNEYTYKVVKTEIESEGDVVLKNQTEINAFADTKITMIKGNLVIGDNSENAVAITDLTPLSGIKEVSGVLQILDNYKGEALDGLNITKVGGIQFGTKDAESKCSETYRFRIESLQEIEGDFQLNNSYVQFIELDNLVKVNGNVYIKGDAVTTLLFPKLLQIERDFDLSENTKMLLTNLEFPLLESVLGRFSMIPSDNLLSVSLPKLQSAGSIDFIFGWGLNKLTIPNLSVVNGDLCISSRWESTVYAHQCNDNLEKIDGLNKLTTVKGVYSITQLGALASLPDFSLITELGGLEIFRNGLRNGSGIICDLSNTTFGNFNEKKPYIDFNGPDAIKSSWCSELRTKEDISGVDVRMSVEIANDYIAPKTNFKKCGSLQLGPINMTLSKDITPLPLSIEEVFGDLNLGVGNASSKNLNLSNLKSVEGTFSINFMMGDILDLSNLVEVGCMLRMTATGTKTIKLDNLKSVGMRQDQGIKGRAISGEDTKEITLFQTNTDFSLPALESVGGNGVVFQGFISLNCPKLKNVATKLLLWNAVRCTDISFPELSSVPKIQIDKLTKLSDFSTFGHLIQDGQIIDGNWEVTGCAYNPTYQDMKDGKYKPE